MPTYKNNGTERATLGGHTIEPGESIETTGWFMTGFLPIGVIQSSETPFDNPIVLSQKISTDVTIQIPAGVDRFFIHVFVESGEVDLLFNSDNNLPVLKLYTGAKYGRKIFDRTVNDLRFTFIISGVVFLIVEKL